MFKDFLTFFKKTSFKIIIISNFYETFNFFQGIFLKFQFLSFIFLLSKKILISQNFNKVLIEIWKNSWKFKLIFIFLDFDCFCIKLFKDYYHLEFSKKKKFKFSKKLFWNCSFLVWFFFQIFFTVVTHTDFLSVSL